MELFDEWMCEPTQKNKVKGRKEDEEEEEEEKTKIKRVEKNIYISSVFKRQQTKCNENWEKKKKRKAHTGYGSVDLC